MTDAVEPDRIASRAPAIALAVSGIAVALAVAVVLLLAGAFTGGGEAAAVPDTMQPPSVPFALPTTGELHRAAVRAHLDGWRWANAAHTRVVLPIQAAIARELATEPAP
jgi:hypothetical protein